MVSMRFLAILNLFLMVGCASLSGIAFAIGLLIQGFIWCVPALIALSTATRIVLDAVPQRSYLSAVVNIFAVLVPLWNFAFTFSISVVIYAATGEATVGLLGVMFFSALFPIALTEQWRSARP
jgi:hypothetical protein